MQAIETPSLTLEPAWLVEVQTPQEDAERILAAVTAIDPLALSARYDHNAFLGGAGTEVYRPRDGAMAGCEDELRQRPGVVALQFELPDERVLAAVAEAVFAVHSYQDPVIRAVRCLSARSKGHNDSDNPHRWWNTTGDWKTQG